MKNVLLIVASLIVGVAQGICQEEVSIKQGSSVELAYGQFETSSVEINNKTLQGFDLKVEDAETKKWIKGFGMGPKAKVVVDIQPGQVLILKNDSKKDPNFGLLID